MATIEENKAIWQSIYDWKQGGDEWSIPWGGVDMQWTHTLLPRIRKFIPTGTILEIAPGFGRWSQFLLRQCDHLVLVDLTEKCIRTCQQRFSAYSHIAYHVNDGKSLDMISDESIDFVFSFDSLVHAEDDVILAYLKQLPRILKPENGVAFIHHSNLGEYADYYKFSTSLRHGMRLLTKLGVLEPLEPAARALSMTASKFANYAEQAGLTCVSQEVINWHTKRLIDCITVITKHGSRWDRPKTTIRNPLFSEEAKTAFKISKLYD